MAKRGRRYVDREKHQLVVRHFPSVRAKTPDTVLAAKTAQQLLAAILSKDLISRLDHAAYVGHELAKAEIALRIGRPYIQDVPLFE